MRTLLRNHVGIQHTVQYAVSAILALLLFTMTPAVWSQLPHAHATAGPAACATSLWAVIPTPNTGTTGDGLFSVAGVSSSDVWSVGAILDLTHSTATPIAEHWDGTAWSLVSTPPVGDSSGFNYLDGVAAISANDVWAVGSYSTASLGSVTLIEQWNGTKWTVVSSPNVANAANALDAVTALSASNVWAVGYYATTSGASYTLIEHWDGVRWSIIPSPNGSTASTATNILYDLSGLSANNLWAVGQYETSGTGLFLTLAEQWNGTAWSIVSTPNVPAQNNVLSSVAGTSSNDIWAVGDAYATNSSSSATLIEHWNGTAWNMVASPSPGTADILFWVTAIATNDVVAVGSNSPHSLVEQWNGAAWSVVASPDVGSTFNHLIALTALSPTNLWAVGEDRSGTNPRQTLALHYSTLIPAGAGSVRTAIPTTGAQFLCHLTADGTASSAGSLPTLPNPRWQLGQMLRLSQSHRTTTLYARLQ